MRAELWRFTSIFVNILWRFSQQLVIKISQDKYDCATTITQVRKQNAPPPAKQRRANIRVRNTQQEVKSANTIEGSSYRTLKLGVWTCTNVGVVDLLLFVFRSPVLAQRRTWACSGIRPPEESLRQKCSALRGGTRSFHSRGVRSPPGGSFWRST